MNRKLYNALLLQTSLVFLVGLTSMIPRLTFAQPEQPARGQEFTKSDDEVKSQQGLLRPDEQLKQKQPGKGFAAAIRELNLTSEQQQQLLASRPQRQQMRRLTMRIKEERQRLQEIMVQENVSESEIKAQAESLKQALSASVDAKVQTSLALKKVMTHEQFTAFQERMQELKEQPGHGRNHGNDKSARSRLEGQE